MPSWSSEGCWAAERSGGVGFPREFPVRVVFTASLRLGTLGEGSPGTACDLGSSQGLISVSWQPGAQAPGSHGAGSWI